LAKRLRHRGPDWSGVHFQEFTGPTGRPLVNILAHERLLQKGVIPDSPPELTVGDTHGQSLVCEPSQRGLSPVFLQVQNARVDLASTSTVSGLIPVPSCEPSHHG